MNNAVGAYADGRRDQRKVTFERTAIATAMAVLLTAAAVAPAMAAAKPGGGGGSWTGPTAISSINQPDPTRGSQLNDVAVNASGTAIAAWDQFSYTNGGGATIGAAIETGGRWGAPFTVSGAAGFSTTPRVAVGADGTMAVSWTYQDPVSLPSPQQKIQVAVLAAGSAGWVTTTLASGPIGGVQGLTLYVPIGVDSNGNVTAAWTLWNGSAHLVQAATLPKGGSWTAPTSLAPSIDALYPSLSVDARGDAGVAFSVSAYAPSNGTTFAQYVFRAGPTGSWTAPATVSEAIPNTVGYVQVPQVALDATGHATVIYMGYGVEATRQRADGTWSTPGPVIRSSVVGASYLSPDLGVDGAGNSVVAVSIFDPTINVDRASVWVTRGTPDGLFGPAQRLTDPSVPVDAYATRVAVSSDGLLSLVGWIDHYHGTVQVSKLVAGAWSAATTIGKGTAFSSFQEVMGLDAGSSTVARAIWKDASRGTQTMASDYRG